jgi:integrase
MAASQPLQDFVTEIVDTGMRPEEVPRIERKNVDLDQGYVFIPFGKAIAAKRKIPITNRVSDLLEKRLRETKVEFPFATNATQIPLLHQKPLTPEHNGEPSCRIFVFMFSDTLSRPALSNQAGT